MLHRPRTRRPQQTRALDAKGFSLLDLRLGVRMLTRYAVLTVIGTGSLAVAIAIGAAAFAFVDTPY